MSRKCVKHVKGMEEGDLAWLSVRQQSIEVHIKWMLAIIAHLLSSTIKTTNTVCSAFKGQDMDKILFCKQTA